MANRRGCPLVDDQVALRRIAEHMADMEEQGSPCSARAAILRTSGPVVGNSPDAVLWRLQRKWRRDGPALLAAARSRRVEQRQVARLPMAGYLGMCGGLATFAERAAHAVRLDEPLWRTTLAESAGQAVRIERQLQLGRATFAEGEVMRTLRLEELLRRAVLGL